MARIWIFTLLGFLWMVQPASAQLLPSPGEDPYDPGMGPDYGGDAQALVASWYSRFLRRPMDYGAGAWIAALQQGQSPARVLTNILGSGEYYRKAGGTPMAYINALYQDLTGQPPLPQQMQYWLRQMRFTGRRDMAHQLLLFYSHSWQAPAPPPYHSYRHSVPYPRYPYYSNYP